MKFRVQYCAESKVCGNEISHLFFFLDSANIANHKCFPSTIFVDAAQMHIFAGPLISASNLSQTRFDEATMQILFTSVLFTYKGG